MRLLNPSPGEVLDRITILELKITAAGKKEINPSRFIAEKTQLDELLQTWTQWLKEDHVSETVWDTIAMERNSLVAVNTLLWVAEDEIRVLPEDELAKIGEVGLRIHKLNDSRADIVRRLSELYGAEGEVGEKIYGAKIAKQESFLVR